MGHNSGKIWTVQMASIQISKGGFGMKFKIYLKIERKKKKLNRKMVIEKSD